jgi:AcrR family transcriptional regulator
MAAQKDPRANQKERTRAAIVEAASRMLQNGVQPTVAEAAQAAKVSRATAYRYFPTPEALHLEVAGVTPTYAPVENLVTSLTGDDVGARVDRFVEAINGITFADEARMRMALKVYQETWFANRGERGTAPPLREGRRMRWLEGVLKPAQRTLPKKEWRRLQAALALTVGADSMVIMKDVCRFGDDEAKELLRWAAQVLLQAALKRAPGPKSRRG